MVPPDRSGPYPGKPAKRPMNSLAKTQRAESSNLKKGLQGKPVLTSPCLLMM